MSKNFPDSAWYRTGELRIVPSWFGFMRAEEQWRKDCYSPDGLNSMFTTKWKSVGQIPQEINNNIYSYLSGAYKGESQFRRKWRSFIFFFGGMGIKDPQPQSPEDNARWHRNLKRERDKEQEIVDKGDHDG
jgi:hypothetical protein